MRRAHARRCLVCMPKRFKILFVGMCVRWRKPGNNRARHRSKDGRLAKSDFIALFRCPDEKRTACATLEWSINSKNFNFAFHAIAQFIHFAITSFSIFNRVILTKIQDKNVYLNLQRNNIQDFYYSY